MTNRKTISLRVTSESDEDVIMYELKVWASDNFKDISDLEISVSGKDKTSYFPKK